MNSFALSADQIRNRSGVNITQAMAACYLAGAAGDGSASLVDLAERTRMGLTGARDIAYRFGIKFSDYDPLAKAKRLDWRKAADGWELFEGKKVRGHCQASGGGKYTATAFGVSETMWRSRDAMRMVSEKIDALSPELFDGSPVEAVLFDKDGKRDCRLFPDVDADDLAKLRGAMCVESAAA